MQLMNVDSVRNRMHITLSETFDEAQAQALLAEIELRLEELGEGFLVLCDLTSLQQFDQAARRPFRRIMDLCNENGVGKVVRIVPSPLSDFALTVMSYFHYDQGVPVITCKSFEEAARHFPETKP